MNTFYALLNTIYRTLINFFEHKKNETIGIDTDLEIDQFQSAQYSNLFALWTFRDR